MHGIAILRSNTPKCFAIEEEDAFARFLDARPGPYYVVEEGRIVACGGIALDRNPSIAMQLAQGFFARRGFEIIEIEKHALFDRVVMEKLYIRSDAR